MIRNIDLSGCSTACEVIGEGPPVLLIHGAEADRRSFLRLSNALAEKVTVISYDQRDCGESRTTQRPYGLADLARDAAELIGALGYESAVVMGTSFGGRIAQMLAVSHPTIVKGLVLCNTWPLASSLKELHPEGQLRLRAAADNLPGAAEDLARMMYSDAYVNAHPECIDRMALKAAHPARALRRSLASELHHGTFATRTLLLSGSLDKVVPTGVMRRFFAQLENSEFVELAGVAHSMAVEAPELLATHISTFALSCDKGPLDIPSKRLIELRCDIDELDAQIVSLLAERVRKTTDVGRIKALSGEASIDPERQTQRKAMLGGLASKHDVDRLLLDEVYSVISRWTVRNHELLGAKPTPFHAQKT